MILDIYHNYYIAILFLALVFYLLANRNVKTLISIIIIIILGYFIYNYIQKLFKEKSDKKSKNEAILNNDIKYRNDVNTNIYYIKNFTKNLKYMILDENLVNIIFNIRFVKKFDEAKYTDVINYMEKFMKIYIYILSNRFKITDHFSSFLDMKNKILEELYSMFLIIPKELKSIFGLDPYKELYKSIEDFRKHSNVMIKTLERYAKLEKNIIYIEDSKYKTYNKNNINSLP